MNSVTSKFYNLFPVNRNEYKLFFAISLNFILTLYVYSILRNTKDVLVISFVGAELISSLKLWAVLPAAILMMIAYTKLADYFTRLQLYYMLIVFFTGFFVIFMLFLAPNLAIIQPDLSEAKKNLPVLRYIFMIAENWAFSSFYIMSELWGSVMLSLMFWQLSNQIVSIDQAKRFYPFFGFFGQIGLIIAGIIMVQFTEMKLGWTLVLDSVVISVVIAAAIMIANLWLISNKLSSKDAINGTSAKKKKNKPGLMESFKYILASRYIGLIASLIICYGISINLVEGVWKKKLGSYFSDPQDLGGFMGQVQIYTGIATTIIMFIGSYILRKFSWRFAAFATPIMILLTGVLFFSFVIFDKFFENQFAFILASAAFFAVMFGAVQNILSKATKYSLFDATKEMSYIPLDEELKSKGKAAADVMGGRFGKSGGAFIQWSLLSLVSGATLISLAPALFGVFVIIMIWWLISVAKLSVEFEKKRKEEGE
ncbi:MAG: Npt1/Npt2 family nucleotide transporter [Rickettsiales bacterium]